MPDWRRIVEDRLAPLALDEEERAAVVEELAGHFEEEYRGLVLQGLPEGAAASLTLERAGDWQELKKEIESSRRKEPAVNKRVSQFWFPAFSTLFLAMVLLMAIEAFGPRPWVSPSANRLRMTPVAVVYVAWILTLPFVGALGAYLSRRAGATPRATFLSLVFPVLPYFAFFVIGLPVAVVLDDHVAHNILLPALFLGFGTWVLLPGLALLAGGWPVHRFRRRLSARGIAG